MRYVTRSRRSFLKATGAAAATAGLAGCLGDDDDEITFLSWGAYMDESWIEPFEEETGISVNTEVMESGADAMSRIQTDPGAYDVWTPAAPGSAFERAYHEDALEPFELENLPAWDDYVFDELKVDGLYFDDELYGVPMAWGLSGCMYNHEEIDDLEPDQDEVSLDVLWNEDYDGYITSMDEALIQVWYTALYLGQNPDDPDDLDAIQEAMEEHVDLVDTFWSSSAETISDFEEGEVHIGTAWDGAYHRLSAEGEPVSYAFFEEGTEGWIDCFALAAGTENVEAAEQFINYQLAEAARDWFEATGYMIASDAADYTDEELEQYNLEEALERARFPEYVPTETVQEYDELWTDAKV